MNWIKLVVDGIKAVAEIVSDVKSAREASVKDAVTGYASGRSAHEAAANAGKGPGGVDKPSHVWGVPLKQCPECKGLRHQPEPKIWLPCGKCKGTGQVRK